MWFAKTTMRIRYFSLEASNSKHVCGTFAAEFDEAITLWTISQTVECWVRKKYTEPGRVGSTLLSSPEKKGSGSLKPGGRKPCAGFARVRILTIASCAFTCVVGRAPGVQAQGPKSLPPKADALYKQGVSLVQHGHLAEAQRVLLQAEAEAPGSVDIRISLGKLDTLLGQNDEAIRLFRTVEAEAPGDGENEINLAIALAAHGSLEEALVLATKAVASSPRSAAAHHIRAKILTGLRRMDEAQAEYKSGLAVAPRDALTLYDYAQFCEDEGRLQDEVSLLRRLVKVRPAKAQYHFLLARALSRTGDEAGSRRENRETIRLEPENRAALYSLSRAIQKEDPKEAAQLSARFRALQASEEEVNAIRSQGNQGVAAMQAHDWPQAIVVFKSALAACAGCTLEATLEKDLGLSQCQGGQIEEGVISLRRSLTLNPNDLDTLRALEIAERTTRPMQK